MKKLRPGKVSTLSTITVNCGIGISFPTRQNLASESNMTRIGKNGEKLKTVKKNWGELPSLKNIYI